MSIRSRPSRSRLSSMLRRTPSALKSQTRRWVGGDGEAVGEVVAVGRGRVRAAGPTLVERVYASRGRVAQRLAESAFGEAEAVVGCGVEGADARRPRRRRPRRRPASGSTGVYEIADAGGAEGQLGDLDRAASERAPSHPLLTSRRGVRRSRRNSSDHWRQHPGLIDGVLRPESALRGASRTASRQCSGRSRAGPIRPTYRLSARSSSSSSPRLRASRSRSGTALPSATRPTCTRPPYVDIAIARDCPRASGAIG